MISCSESSTGSEPGSGETTGNLEVSVSTTGSGTDGDGYVITKGDESKTVDPDGTVIFEDLEEGSYTIELDGLDMGCTVNSDNPLAVNIAAGETANAVFEVICEQSMAEGTIAFFQRTDESTYSWVAISPDGEKIAFVRREMASSTLDNEIWVIDIDGGTPVNIE